MNTRSCAVFALALGLLGCGDDVEPASGAVDAAGDVATHTDGSDADVLDAIVESDSGADDAGIADTGTADAPSLDVSDTASLVPDVPDVAVVDTAVPDVTTDAAGTDTVDAGAPVCSPKPDSPPVPTGPLPSALAPGAGIDDLERPAYEALRDSVLADPGVHFVATYDWALDAYVVESGPTDARSTLVFRRTDAPGGGSQLTVLDGDVADVFPSTEPDLYGTYEDLLASFANPNGYVPPLDQGYAEGDPRVGFLPPEAQSYPWPLLRIAALFDARDAPDLVGGLYPWAGGGAGSHGSMGLLQSRSTLILSGKGAKKGVVTDGAALLPDVVPTALAALGAPTTAGTGPDGTYDDGLYLLRQDGRVLWEALSDDPCERPKHVIIALFDGLAANEIGHEALDPVPDADVPTFRDLAGNGVVYRHGAVTNFPSVSVPGHMTAGTGLWSGHHGMIANDFFRREVGLPLSPYSLISDISATLADPSKALELYDSAVDPTAETIAMAAHRSLGAFDFQTGEGAFVAVINEMALGGADFTTIDYLLGGKVFGGDTSLSLSDYGLADDLAVAEVKDLLLETGAPVPTILQLSMVLTDGAGEAGGPHSDLLREMLEGTDARLGEVLSVYEQLGALEDTLVIVVSDHGMELQDPTRAAHFGQAIAASGVRLEMPFPGLAYLRTLEVDVEMDGGIAHVLVRNHDNASPVEGASVTCGGCEAVLTGADGIAELAVPTPDTEIEVTHPDYNPQKK